MDKNDVKWAKYRATQTRLEMLSLLRAFETPHGAKHLARMGEKRAEAFASALEAVEKLCEVVSTDTEDADAPPPDVGAPEKWLKEWNADYELHCLAGDAGASLSSLSKMIREPEMAAQRSRLGAEYMMALQNGERQVQTLFRMTRDWSEWETLDDCEKEDVG